MTAGTNEIKAFAYDSGANVLTQAEWAALTTTLQDGFSAGILPSKNLNKALRQSSLVAAAVAQVVANGGVNVADDGDYAALANKVADAIRGLVVGQTSYYKTSGTHSTTVPAGRTCARIRVWGAGGGAAHNTGAVLVASEGGGSGAYAEKLVTGLVPGTAVTVVIGAGGVNRQDTTGAAGSGGSSSVAITGGPTITANGGAGGDIDIGAPGAGGAAGTSGDLDLPGQSGRDGTTYTPSGDGGSAPFGGAGGISGRAPGWPGGGGSLAADGAYSANGADGGVIIEWH